MVPDLFDHLAIARYAHENSLRIIPIKLGHRYPPEPPDVHGRKQNEEIFKRILYLDGKKMEERDVAETWFELEVQQYGGINSLDQYTVVFDTLVLRISSLLDPLVVLLLHCNVNTSTVLSTYENKAQEQQRFIPTVS